jgi:hypothetical protein
VTFLDGILFTNGMDNEVNPEIPLRTRLPVAERAENGGIIYSKDGNSDIPREIMFAYLQECANMILYLPNIYEIIADSQNLDVGLHEAAVFYQQGIVFPALSTS